MIVTQDITKRFDDVLALDHVSAEIQNSSVFGLIGSNGAGKSTFLRILAGVLQPDEGSLLIDGQPVFENLDVKHRCFYISDESFFFSGYSPEELKNYYAIYYPKYDHARWNHLMKTFGLDPSRRLRTFSKGMKKQVSVICGLCSGADYLFCDETFDGLDPVMRQAVKSLFAEGVADRGLTPVVASHNLRELEDICDHVGLLHRGGILFSRDLDDMRLGIHKLQVIFTGSTPEVHFDHIEVLTKEQRGSLYTMIVRGTAEDVQNEFHALQPMFFEMLPLTLEEIFISETEVAGYDIKKLLF